MANMPTDDETAEGVYYRDVVIPKMDALRAAVDEAETMTSSEYWPVPSYGDMLFSV